MHTTHKQNIEVINIIYPSNGYLTEISVVKKK